MTESNAYFNSDNLGVIGMQRLFNSFRFCGFPKKELSFDAKATDNEKKFVKYIIGRLVGDHSDIFCLELPFYHLS